MDIADDDVLRAMKEIQGYIDITTGDFKEIYRIVYRYAWQRLTQSIVAGDVMTKDVVSVKEDARLEEVAQTMGLKEIAGVPVVDDDNRVVGVISEKDFLARMGGKKTGSFIEIVALCLRTKGCIAIPMREQRAQEIMTSPAVTVSEDATVSDITDMLIAKNINRLPVTDRKNRLVGIVTRADIIHSYFSLNG
jgi:CBS-domain-containing membrane protein